MVVIRLIEDGEYPFHGYPRAVRALVEIHGENQVHMVAMTKDQMWEKTISSGDESLSQFKDELLEGKIRSQPVCFDPEQIKTIVQTRSMNR